MTHDEPIRFQLKPDDDAAPAPDPQQAGIELMAVLRAIDETRDDLQRLFTRWGDDPIGTMRKAQSRTIELQQLVAQAAPLGETLIQAFRAAGTFAPARRP
jgi:hypothetical protein